MGGPTSQNIATRHSGIDDARRRRIAVSLAGAVAFLIAVWMAADYIAGSELARTIDANLAWLADPRSWLE